MPQAPNNPYRLAREYDFQPHNAIDELRNQAPGLTIRDLSFLLASHHATGRLRGREEGREPLPAAYDDGYAAGHEDGRSARDREYEDFFGRNYFLGRLQQITTALDEALDAPRKRDAEPLLRAARRTTERLADATRADLPEPIERPNALQPLGALR